MVFLSFSLFLSLSLSLSLSLFLSCLLVIAHFIDAWAVFVSRTCHGIKAIIPSTYCKGDWERI